MATLRGNRALFSQPGFTLEDDEAYRARNMSDLRRGYTAGRIGTQANSALADLSSARAAGDEQTAADLASRVNALRQRQSTFSPRVGRVENIQGIGDGIDWAQSMVGQGVASMQDPVAAATAATALGTGLSFVPNPVAKAVGTGLRTAGAFAAPYAINQRQLKGEFYGQAMEDPEIMRNFSAQQLDDRANLQGAGAAALDSIVPAVVGRGLGGAGLRAGLSGTGPAARTIGGMAMEGLTEVGQGEISRSGLRDLNPERAEENVGLDRLNEFAGGAVGAGPFTAAGAYADAGFRRAGATAEQTSRLAKEKAGQVVDMYDGSTVQSGVDASVQKAKGLFNRGKDAVIDLQSGKVTATDIKNALKEKTKGTVDMLGQTLEERSILSGEASLAIPADAPDFETRFLAEEAKRGQLIADKLAAMNDDPTAAELFERAFNSGLAGAEQAPILDEAADYILQKSDLGRLVDKAERSSSAAGKIAGYAGKMAGRLGSAAWDVTKGAAKGFNEGRKLNAQVESDPMAPITAERQQAAEQALSLERAKNFAAYLEDGVRSREERFKAVKPGVDLDRLAKYVGDLGYEIADLADQWSPVMDQRPTRDDSSVRSLDNDTRLRERQRTGQSEQGGPQSLLPQGGPNFAALTLALNRIATDLNSAYGADAAAELNALAAMASPESAPFFRFLEEQLAVVQSKQGAAETAKIRRWAQDEILRAFDPATTNKLLRNGINVYKPEGKRTLLGMVESIYNGRAAPQFQKALADVVGREVLDGMLQAIDTQTREFAADLDEQYVDDGGREINATESGLDMNDDGDVVESVKRESNMIEKQAQRAADTRSGGRLFGFFGMDKPRTDKNRDPFRGDKTVTAKQLAEWDESVKARKAEGLEPDWDNDPRATGRPRLIPLDGTSDQRAKALMERRLKMDQTPARMLEMLKAEAADSTKRRRIPDASKVGPNRMVRDVALVEQKMAEAAAGNEQAKAWLADRTEAFFTNRAGAWRVVTKSAADIMRERDVQRPQVLSMYRDYMRQEAARNERAASTARKNAEAAKTDEGREQNLMAAEGYADAAREANYEAKIAGQALTDAMDQSKTKEDGQGRSLRLAAGTRRQIFDRAREYFENNGVVVAERLSDRDPNVLSEEDILELGRQGEKVADLARRDGVKKFTDRNILIFDSPLMGNKENKLYVSAGQLVYNARQRRMMSEPVDFEGTDKSMSNRAKNEEFLSDLMDGLGMMIASGQVNGLPSFYNADGKLVSFKDRVPEDLMLATSKFSGVEFSRQQRVAKGPSKKQEFLDGLDDTDFEERRQELVALDQARNEEPFVADARMEQEPSGVATRKPRGQQRAAFAEFDDLNDTVLRGEEGGGRYTERRITDNRTDRKPREAKVDSEEGKKRLRRTKIEPDNATPLDFFPKQDADEIRDEFAEQRRQSVVEGKTTQAVKSVAFKKGRMDTDGKRIGNELVTEISNDPTTGAERVLEWMRLAQRSDYNASGGVVGGLHLAMPAAVALNRDTISTYSPDDREQFVAMRGDLARIIKASDAPMTTKIALMRAMASEAQAAKITSANFKALLDKIDGEAPDLGAMGTSTRTKREIDAASTKAVADYRATTKVAPAGDGRQVAVKRQAPAKLTAPERVAALKAQRAAAPAPEVAGSVGKPQTSPSGTSSRKLNAQTGENADGQARLITRLADARADEFAAADPDSLFWRKDGEVSFGPVRGGTYFFLSDAQHTHAFVVAPQQLEALTRALEKYPTDRHADVLTYFAAQHAFRDRKNGNFESFGPAPEAPAGKMLAERGALSNTGEKFSNGVAVTRVEGVSGRQVADFLAEALAYSKRVEGGPIRVNWTRTTGANRGKGGTGVFNSQDPTGSVRPATPEEMQAARDFVKKVLGPQVRVDFKDITGYAGEWLEAQDVIEIATASAPGAMQVAYHESLHAFFSKFAKDNAAVRNLLQTLVMDPELNERTLALLDKYPAAQDAFRESAEERLAYMFQFWNAGLLTMPQGGPKNLFQKLKSFFRRVLGRVSDSERAMVILEAFRDGKLAGEPSAAAKVINAAVERGTWTTRKMRKVDNLMQKARSLVLPAQTILNSSESATARKLGLMFWTNPGEAAHGTEGEGYLNARMRHPMQYKNRLSAAIQGLNEADLLEVTKYLQMEKDNLDEIAYKPQREAAKKIRGLLQRFRKYMVEDSGVDMGDRGPFYFPRVWNTDALFKQTGPFIDMLKAKYDYVLTAGVEASENKMTKDEVAQRILSSLINNSVARDHLPPSRDDGVLAPFFAQKEMRELAWLDSADAEPFLEKNMMTTLTQYFHNGSRSAEYVRRFGNDGEKLRGMLELTEQELKRAAKNKYHADEFDTMDEADAWVERQMKQIHTSVGAMEGTLGKDISDLWRETSTWTTVYQNIRLLPLTLFASVADPMGVLARGGEMKGAFEAFKRGMVEVARSWKEMASDNPSDKVADKWEQLARDAGIVDAAMFAHFVSDEYSSVYMSKTAKKVNDKFFQLNGMEGWNRGARVGATKAAALFLQRHKRLPDANSERWLTELGLKADEIHLDADGNLITNWRVLVAEKGMPEIEAQRNIGKIHYALSRWVHGAIITPNAAQRPGWSSDPHYSMFFHLKQFMYSFHMTILKRAVNELQEGNLAPIAAFAWYIPVMIASDITKGLIQGGGELPPYMKAMDPGEWVLHGIERAGLLGVGTIGVDASQDIFSLGGPMVEQIIDSFGQELGDTTLRALPANPVYANWVD